MPVFGARWVMSQTPSHVQEFNKTSKTLIKNKKEPKYKKVFRLDLSGFKKLILDIIFLL